MYRCLYRKSLRRVLQMILRRLNVRFSNHVWPDFAGLEQKMVCVPLSEECPILEGNYLTHHVYYCCRVSLSRGSDVTRRLVRLL
jgi:hypothetical protein